MSDGKELVVETTRGKDESFTFFIEDDVLCLDVDSGDFNMYGLSKESALKLRDFISEAFGDE